MQDSLPLSLAAKLPLGVQDAAVQRLSGLLKGVADTDAPPVVYQAMSAFASIVRSGFQPSGLDFANLLQILDGADLWEQAIELYSAVPCQARNSSVGPKPCMDISCQALCSIKGRSPAILSAKSILFDLDLDI